MAFFIIPSTASGACSQSGIVRTAFVFAAAARKSSTVFRFSAQRSRIALASKATGTRSEVVFINFVQTEEGHRFTQIFTDNRRNFAESVFYLCSSVANDRKISARVYSGICRDRSDRTGRNFHRTWHEGIQRTSEAASFSRALHRSAGLGWFHFSRQNYFQSTRHHGGRLPSRRGTHSACACCARAGRLRPARSRRQRRVWSRPVRNAADRGAGAADRALDSGRLGRAGFYARFVAGE